MAGLNFDSVAPAQKALSFDDVAPEKKPPIEEEKKEESAQLDISRSKMGGTAIDAAAVLLEQPGALTWQIGSAGFGGLVGIKGAAISRLPGISDYLESEGFSQEQVKRYQRLSSMSIGDAFVDEYNRASTNASSMYVPISDSGAKLTRAISQVFQTATKAYPEWMFEHTDFLPSTYRALLATGQETAINAALLLLTPEAFKGKAPGAKPEPTPKGEPAPAGAMSYQDIWNSFKERYPATAGQFEASSIGKIRTDDFIARDKNVFDAVSRKLDEFLQLPEEKRDMTFEGKLRAAFQKLGPDVPPAELDKASRATIDGLRQLDALREARANERGLPVIPDPAVSKEPVVITKGGVAITPEQAAASDVAFTGMSLEERANALGMSAMGRRRLEVEAWQVAKADGDSRAVNKARGQLERNWARDFPYRDPEKRSGELERFINFGGRMTWEELAGRMGPALRGGRERGVIEIEKPEKPDRFTYGGYTYFRVGAKVNQDAYPGQPATIVEVREQRHRPTLYKVKIELSRDHPEAVDENGNPQFTKYQLYDADQLNSLNEEKPVGYWQGPGGTSDIVDTYEVPGIKERATELIRGDRRWTAYPTGGKGKQKGMIEIEGLTPDPDKQRASSRPWPIGSQEQERPLADRLDAAYNANFTAEEEGIKESFGDKAAKLKRGVFGHNIDLKDALEKSGPYGEKARLRMVLQTGATDAARYDADQINKNIFIPLSADEKVLLDKLIRDKVIIEIKSRNPEYRVPEGADVDGRTAEAHARQMARTLGVDNYKKLEGKADAVFNVYRHELVRGLENGLYPQETFDKLIHFNYEPTQYIDLIDPVQQFTIRGKSISIRSSGLQYLGGGKTDSAVRMDSRALLFELIARNRNREFKNNTLKSLWDLADVNPDNGLVMIQSEGKSGKHPPSGWTALGVRIEGEQRQILMKDDFAEQFVQVPQGIDSWVRNVAALASGSGFLRETAVGANPLFPIAGIPMDIAHTWAAKGAEYSSHIPVYLKQIGEDMLEVLPDLKKKSGVYADAMREGLGSHFMAMYGQEVFTRDKTLAEKMAPKYEKIMHTLRGANQEADIWIRLAHRDRLIKMGLDSWEATARARDRLDYSESGILTRSVDTVWPWTSVAMEALYKAGKAISRDPKDFGLKMAWVFGSYTAWNMGNMLASPETWKNISTSDKMRGLQITYGDQLYVLDQEGNRRYFYTPLRFDQVFSPIQATVVGSLELAQYGKLPNNIVSETMNQTFNIWNPLDGVPIMGAAAAMMNFDPYTGKPIFKGTVKPEDETRPGTHPAFTMVGAMTGQSPMRMEAAASKIISPYNPWVMAAGFGLRQILGDTDYRAKARLGEHMLAENLRPIIKLTNPMSGMVDGLVEKEQEEGSRRKHQTDRLDELVFGAQHDQNTMKDVSVFIGNQPPEDRERLMHRATAGYKIDKIMEHYQAGSLEGVPPKGWWKATAAAPARVRAQEYYSKWLSADTDGRRTMDRIAVSLENQGAGYMSDEFKREMMHEKSRLGTDAR